MSFKDDLMQLYIDNSPSYKAFKILLSDLKVEMIDLARKGEECIYINQCHKLSSILKHKDLLIHWCNEQGLDYNGTYNDSKLNFITINWTK